MMRELPEKWKDAQNIESLPNWRSWMPFLTPECDGYIYVNGEPRRYYKHVTERYFYRIVPECEMHRNR